jgi:hypothetical protein
MTAVAAFTSPTDIDDRLNAWRKQLDCAFTQIDAIFAACMAEASTTLSEDGLIDFLAQARFLGKMGRGPEPVLTFLQEWPPIARTVGEDALSPVMVTVRLINKSPNGNAIAPFLQTWLPWRGVCRPRPSCNTTWTFACCFWSEPAAPSTASIKPTPVQVCRFFLRRRRCCWVP